MKTSSYRLFRHTPGGVRISVGRPRFLSTAGMPYFPELAPQRSWLEWPRDEYVAHFRDRLAGLNAQEVYDRIVGAAYPNEPVLLCFEVAPLTAANWCHRSIVAEWFEQSIGIEIPEFILPPLPMLLN